MSTLINPYKIGRDHPPVRQIIADVGEADWNKVWRRHPYRGLQDALFGSLFYNFVQALPELPDIYDPSILDTYKQTLDSLRGHAVSSVDRS